MRLLPLLLLFSFSLATAADSRLQQDIERVARSVNAQWGVYNKCLETGAEIAINADKQMEWLAFSLLATTGATGRRSCPHRRVDRQ